MSADPFPTIIEAQSGAHCTSYLVIATVERLDEEDSTVSLYMQSPNHQTMPTTLGLLRAAQAIEESRIVQHFE